MIPTRIYLVGMPGSGKTTLANLLANRIAYQAIDMDELIAKQEQMSIADIFHQKGEDYFRQKEREVLKKTFSMSRVVVATGGGTPCFFDNMEQINKHGLAVFINVSLTLIATRLERQPGARPLIDDSEHDDLLQTLKALYQKRYPHYDMAEVAVSGLEINADYIYNKIRTYLDEIK